MKTKWPCALAFILTGCIISTALAYDPGADDIVAVSGRASPDYIRVRQKDGSYAPETYSFGKGGDWAGAMKDDSIDMLTFLDVAHVIAGPLAEKHYVPCTDLEKTKLLIMVYWGTTRAPEHAMGSNGAVELQLANNALASAQSALTSAKASGSASALKAAGSSMADANGQFTEAIMLMQAENRQRRQEDMGNIKMLGYDSWFEQTNWDSRGTAFEQSRRDMWDEIEQNRYFVVLMAYDFQLMREEKKHRLLWETRFSIRQQHHQFDKELPSLAKYASRYFGQDSGGLVRDRVPLGQVEIGEVKSLGEAAPPQK
jgi:hypothetical protein